MTIIPFKRIYSRILDLWKRFSRNRAAVVGLVIVGFFSFFALFAPIVAPNDPFQLGGNQLQSPSVQWPMGTDDVGRNVLSGVIWGSRVSLIVGLLAAATSTVIGVIVGTVGGYIGGVVDDLLMRFTEFFMVIPRIFLALVMITVFGPSIFNIVFVIGILSWPVTARLVRAEVLSLREQSFVEAARVLGMGDLKIVFSEILPNATPSVIVNASLQVASAILLEAGLSFLGLGDPSVMSWGSMLNNAQTFLAQAWWMAVFPGLAIFLAVEGLNLVGDGLNDALNPRLKERQL